MSESTVGALRFPYHSPRVGFWGEKTVTLNFCEEVYTTPPHHKRLWLKTDKLQDYVISYYCAEVCNTLTNVLFIWLGLKGIRGCIKYSHPTIFVVAFLGYMVVGIGSTLFHATLKYPMQLVDELSMIYATCLMCFATFSYARSTSFSLMLGLGLVGLSWFITARYYHTKDPQFHQDAYALLTALVVFSNMWIMEKSVRPALRERQAKRSSRSTIPPADTIVRELWLLVATGITIFLGGWLIWNLDNVYCDTIIGWRHRLQLPWAVLLEGHAWWHLMTGIGGKCNAGP
ncbi:alkaline phytoceramidase-like protein [Xylariales sp. AK1849]|nr:alkaline phytoceramidase-like protein [Xylariales sp. AK1849]